MSAVHEGQGWQRLKSTGFRHSIRELGPRELAWSASGRASHRRWRWRPGGSLQGVVDGLEALCATASIWEDRLGISWIRDGYEVNGRSALRQFRQITSELDGHYQVIFDLGDIWI